jgi:hypothetical protein
MANFESLFSKKKPTIQENEEVFFSSENDNDPDEVSDGVKAFAKAFVEAKAEAREDLKSELNEGGWVFISIEVQPQVPRKKFLKTVLDFIGTDCLSSFNPEGPFGR